ncbi:MULTISPECIES: DMT family transporter [Oceanobacillus]|uniref:EamA-like transporter family protein n=2 Tax=Oceanobacillus TaxID=182709 RepID=A0A0A1MS67_9BACI|nr:DMT family transporter [Oceanobacillus oncorhynchi]MDM8099846.1 DMT family transporter [Oceanobacillus oncorhynchi]UUI40386.1 DMT family transporter [Oceanobacillus oncorhynchi]CEI81806.1 EamA-like transporter family protein [Oceanobacillus oncorhynchi]
MSDRNKGILLLLLSALGFSLMAMFVKLSGDVPTIQKTLFRNGISMVIALGFVLYHRERLFGKKENQKYLLLRSALGMTGVLLNFYAIDHLVLSDADMLNKMSPFITIIFAAVFLKEYVMRFQVVSVIIAFLGTLFIIKPVFNLDMVPYAAGILSAVFAGGAYTVLRVLGNKEQFYTVVFYFSFFSTVILLPPVILFYQPMSGLQWLYLLAAGVFATVGQFGITVAYKFAPAKEISIFFYSTVVYSGIISIALFGQIPDIWSILGYLAIFGASFYMFLRNNRDLKEVKE